MDSNQGPVLLFSVNILIIQLLLGFLVTRVRIRNTCSEWVVNFLSFDMVFEDGSNPQWTGVIMNMHMHNRETLGSGTHSE